jgi:hypothetical protein
VKNLRLHIYIIIEVFLVIIAWIIFINLGKLNIALVGQHIDDTASGLLQSLYPLLIIITLVPFLAILFCIFWEIHLILLTKKQKQAKVEKSMSELLTITEEETEEQVAEREKKTREKYEKLKQDILRCFDEKIGDKSKLGHKQLSEKVLSCISGFYEITQAEIFLRQISEADDKLTLSATYAFYVPEEKVFEFNIGDGLIGQVAKAGNSLYLDNIPEGYITVKSGLGSATPSNLLICPWKDNKNNVFAVLEIAAFKTFSKEDIELFEELAHKLADWYSSENN